MYGLPLSGPCSLVLLAVCLYSVMTCRAAVSRVDWSVSQSLGLSQSRPTRVMSCWPDVLLVNSLLDSLSATRLLLLVNSLQSDRSTPPVLPDLPYCANFPPGITVLLNSDKQYT